MDLIDDNAYELSREFPVTQDGLFDAFINEAILKKYLGVSSITVDARPNGQARALRVTKRRKGENGSWPEQTWSI